LPWADDDAFEAAVSANMDRLLERAEQDDGTWAVFWAAGAAVTSSTIDQLEHELSQLELVVAEIGRRVQASGLGHRGSLFYSSSVGGIYGGSTNPPFTEQTNPHPLSPYGRYKLKAEQAVADLSSSGVRVLNGRIANLYGPGQRLDKMQGLISQLARAQYSPSPASIYVSLETVRDYIYVTDCADLICDAMERLSGEPAGSEHTKILASGQGTTIATLLGHFRTLAKGHPHVMLGSSPSASMQAHDLRVMSTTWADLDKRELTPLPAGIRATMEDIVLRLQSP
jgi:UDP-glucose 4-epimerase